MDSQYSIASSSLSEKFEDILLECHFTDESNRQEKKEEWKDYNEPRGKSC